MENEEEVEKIPRDRNVWMVAAGALGALFTGILIVIILALALAGCATVKPYVGKETTVTYREQFVSWDTGSGVMVKHIFIDNPYKQDVRVTLDCDTPVNPKYDVTAQSTKEDTIFDDSDGLNHDACRIAHWEYIFKW